MGISAVCQRGDAESNLTTTLGLSKCIAYNIKESKLEWKIPPSCTNSTTVDEKKMNSTQGNLVELDDYSEHVFNNDGRLGCFGMLGP
ncbi:hypothetical protein NCU08723 [Neurospora crassa OR74A]|uniref:Uncharacterized protein n=1 Tax=Neurospora crassa (strain ATCC 24698 / 74-OR23-1A / CBS 708.71 / DSM 1257 / FGSC 987) TaxID=367110 RepID=V5IR70_NEUCR|nr:hypothetical protein NCU08723 [Neurospora crassa OR74A]ESA43701.1 hypothetical protein NCU08723 [Neurospora crassa OR74A]|eukprot:XP_011393627.1 hypothetical protein NCU08723 [Neurospora crassa OR74A]